jgi:hypothetical protein
MVPATQNTKPLPLLLQALMGLSARPTSGPGDTITATLAFPMAVKVRCSCCCAVALWHGLKLLSC